MSIEIDKEIAIDLIHSKIEILDSKIRVILDQWNYNNIDEFIQDVKKGLLEEAEDSAIDLENLRDKRNQIATLLDQ